MGVPTLSSGLTWLEPRATWQQKEDTLMPKARQQTDPLMERRGTHRGDHQAARSHG